MPDTGSPITIFGVDFTSAPGNRKPITCASCILQDESLFVQGFQSFTTFAEFEAFLRFPGSWVAGFDFPFGQPRRLIENLGWPGTWAGYVSLLSRLDMRAFEALLKQYRDPRPRGDKQHLRATDRLAGARSPMMLYGVPVGRMFFRGAHRLLQAGLNILPCHPTASDRVALEVYPALVMQRVIGRHRYKSDMRARQTEAQLAARRAMIAALQSAVGYDRYGVTVRLPRDVQHTCMTDAQGDYLDAVLCALPAAWAYTPPLAGVGDSA